MPPEGGRRRDFKSNLIQGSSTRRVLQCHDTAARHHRSGSNIIYRLQTKYPASNLTVARTDALPEAGRRGALRFKFNLIQRGSARRFLNAMTPFPATASGSNIPFCVQNFRPRILPSFARIPPRTEDPPLSWARPPLGMSCRCIDRRRLT